MASQNKNDGDDSWMIDVLRQLRVFFEEFDHNHDGVLQREELEALIEKRHATVSEAQIVAMLCHCFEAISALNKERWFERSDGITLCDLILLEQLLGGQEAIDSSDDKTRLKRTAFNVLKRTKDIWKLKPTLYGSDSEPETSIRPIAIRRGNLGDCFFLASLAALARTNPGAIASMIEVNKDDSYTVIFPGGKDTGVRVPKPNVVELSLYGQYTRMGYWPCVMEQAYLMQLDGQEENIGQSLELLTGKTAQKEDLNLIEPAALEGILESVALSGRCVVVVSKGKSSDTTMDAPPPVVCENANKNSHPYTFLEWEKERGRVVLRDPYGPLHRLHSSGARVSSQKRPSRQRDGIFSLDLKELISEYGSLYLEGS